MKLFIFSDLNISSIQPILKSYLSSNQKIIFQQINGLGWEESIQNINKQNVSQSDFILFWFSRSNLLNAQLILDHKKSVDNNIIENIYMEAEKKISYFMERGLNIIFINSSSRFITFQDFKFENDLKKYSRSWDHFCNSALERIGINVIYESDYLETNHFSQRLWYLAKNPFSSEYLKLIAEKIIRIIKSKQNPIKVLAFDLDDTIWGGVIGEDGIDGIRLGGHDLKGELFLDIQKVILNAKSNGILIGVLSKNNKNDAMQVFRKHREMLIKESDLDFAFCNWEEKYLNLQKVAINFNLSYGSFCFLDNSSIEREKMLKILPEVQTIDLPLDNFKWATTLSNFLNVSNYSTLEDNLRNNHYKLEQLRSSEIKNNSLENYSANYINKILEVFIEEEKFDLMRAEQLFLRTNQFNLSTRRLNRKQILSFKEDPNKFIKLFRVKDKFGDYGICGVYCAIINNEKLSITDLAISCRALGRGVEDFLLKDIKDFSKKNNLDKIQFNYNQSEKNRPVFDFFSKKWFLKDNYYVIDNK